MYIYTGLKTKLLSDSGQVKPYNIKDVDKLMISDDWHHFITQTNADTFSVGLYGINFIEIRIQMQNLGHDWFRQWLGNKQAPSH